MIGGLLSRLTWSQKLNMALRAVGASPEELAALDGVVAELAATPVGYTFFPEVNSLAKLLDALPAVTDAASEAKDTYGHLLANPRLREVAAKVLTGYLARSEYAGHISSLLDKIKLVPGVNLDAYDSLEDYIAQDLLPKLVPAAQPQAEHLGTVVVCRFCKQPFLAKDVSR